MTAFTEEEADKLYAEIGVEQPQEEVVVEPTTIPAAWEGLPDVDALVFDESLIEGIDLTAPNGFENARKILHAAYRASNYGVKGKHPYNGYLHRRIRDFLNEKAGETRRRKPKDEGVIREVVKRKRDEVEAFAHAVTLETATSLEEIREQIRKELREELLAELRKELGL